PDPGADDIVVWADEPWREEIDVPQVRDLDAERGAGAERHVTVELQVLVAGRALPLGGLLAPPEALQAARSGQECAVHVGVVGTPIASCGGRCGALGLVIHDPRPGGFATAWRDVVAAIGEDAIDG